MEQANIQQDQEQILVAHLTELRKRIIIVLAFFILSLIAGFVASPTILTFIKQQPSAVNIDWNVFGFADGITIYFKCALVVSLLVTLPVALYQTWLFVKPGLTAKEKKVHLFLFRSRFSYSF